MTEADMTMPPTGCMKDGQETFNNCVTDASLDEDPCLKAIQKLRADGDLVYI